MLFEGKVRAVIGGHTHVKQWVEIYSAKNETAYYLTDAGMVVKQFDH